MRDYCSGCGESYLLENMNDCECGRSLCYRCLQTHQQESGHQSRSERERGWQQDPVDMRGIFCAAVTQRIFDRMDAEPAVQDFACRTSQQVFTGRMVFQAKAQAERFFEFHLSFQEYQALLAQAGGNQQSAIEQYLDKQLALFIRRAIQWEMESMSKQTLFQSPWASWQACTDAAREDLSMIVEPHLGDAVLSTELQINTSQLPFYPQGQLISYHDPNWPQPSLTLYLLQITSEQDKPRYYTLNGLSAPIHDANRITEMRLTEETVLAYLHFFCFFVQGGEGPFYMIAEADDSLLPSALWNFLPVEKEDGMSLKQFFRPPVIKKVGALGEFYCSCFVFYDSALFIADFIVQPDGMIEMESDESIYADLPFQLKQPLSMSDRSKA